MQLIITDQRPFNKNFVLLSFKRKQKWQKDYVSSNERLNFEEQQKRERERLLDELSVELSNLDKKATLIQESMSKALKLKIKKRRWF